MPNERWDDFALDREFEHIGDQLEALRELPTNLGKWAAASEDCARQVERMDRDWRGALEQLERRINERLQSVHRRINEQNTEQKQKTTARIASRATIIAAAIGAIAIVAVAIINLVILLHGGS